ncbi:unnamed protein product [Caenorhabditis brenneri]
MPKQICRNFPHRRKRGFSLPKLPMLARVEVIRSMELGERLRLSLTSTRMRFYVKEAKTSFRLPEITVENGFARVKTEKDKFEVFCDTDGFKINKKRLYLISNSLVSNISYLLQHIQKTFSTGYFTLTLQKNIPKVLIKEIHSDPVLMKWSLFIVKNQKVNTEDLNLIMEKTDKNKTISFINTELPPFFRHKNVFKFGVMDYEDARWVHLEDLISIRHTTNILLGTNYLSSVDVTYFLQYWFRADEDMFLWMDLRLNPDVQLDKVLAGKVVLENVYQNHAVFFTLSTSTSGNRKYPLLGMELYSENMRLTAWGADEPFTPDHERVEQFGKEYDILVLLERKRQLEACLAWYNFGREAMYSELAFIDQRLKSMNVRYINGVATITHD